MEEIRKEPYKYICDWAESLLIHVGKQTFEVLSLLPCSLILPDIPYETKYIRPQINAMILSPPSGGKSTIAEKFAKMSMNPLTFRRISATELISQIIINPELFTIINEDFSQVAEDYDVIKVLEGVTGDERKISDKTNRRNIEINTKAVALICGTPSDLTRYIQNLEGGMFFRLVPIMINHSPEQHSEIGKYINSKIGTYDNINLLMKKEENILNYYKELRAIQAGENREIKPIIKYNIPDDIRQSGGYYWDKITTSLVKGMNFYWIRELHEFYRFLVAHAFLNVYNRKITPITMNGIEGSEITINKEDYEVALKLMKQNIKFKYCLIKATGLNRHITSAEALKIALDSKGVPSQAKNILKNISPYSSSINSNKDFND